MGNRCKSICQEDSPMYAVGIDVSSRHSTAAVLSSPTTVVCKPFDVPHTPEGIAQLAEKLNALDGEKRIVMEHTGRYYESVAHSLHSLGFYVCAVNPLLIKEYSENTLRKVKTDQADAVKIARYTLANWESLRRYTPEDETRYLLKAMNTQFQLVSKTLTALTNNLIALMEQTYPGVRSLFDSPARPDGSQKWTDYAKTFWHVDCVRGVSESDFVDRYRKWCQRNHYNFNASKASSLYADAGRRIAVMPKSASAGKMIKETIALVNAVSLTVETLRNEMDRLASALPEYDTVMNMYGAGKSTGPQIMAEIGDPRRFAGKNSLVAFGGLDPGKNESGDKNCKSVRTSKRGSPALRRTLFMIMTVLLQHRPADDPVYQFLDRKRREGKPYYSYMNAGSAKFLRVYYGKVRDSLIAQGLWNCSTD